MTLIIREDDVRQLLTMPATITALEDAFRAWGQAVGENISRQRLVLPSGVLHVLPAAVPGMDALGLKAYTTIAGEARFMVVLYRASTGELLALIEADWLGRMRTGAASGLATQYLARQDAKTLGMLGAGGQAETQLMAIAAVRPIERAMVWGRNPQRLADFCTRMTAQIGIPVMPAASPEAAVSEAAVVVTITTARDPVLRGAWLAEGAHVNVVGSNWFNRREVDVTTLTRAHRIVADSIDQARLEAGDLIIPSAIEGFDWDRVSELRDIVAGKTPGREQDQEITVFKSLGIGLEDVATAMRVYTLALSHGLGTEIPFL